MNLDPDITGRNPNPQEPIRNGVDATFANVSQHAMNTTLKKRFLGPDTNTTDSATLEPNNKGDFNTSRKASQFTSNSTASNNETTTVNSTTNSTYQHDENTLSNDPTTDDEAEVEVKTNATQILYVEGEPHVYSKSMKVILQWNNYFGKSIWYDLKLYGQDPYIQKCEVDACFLTNNNSHLELADFVMFHFCDRPNFPEVRYPHQSYVHELIERPLPEPSDDWIQKYEGRINLTYTYRQDADIYLWPYSFPLLQKRLSGAYKLRIPLANRRYSAIWPVSHCITSSRREVYVQELSKYIDVHIYGGCGNYSCAKRPWYSCFKMFESTYKFYLSFENSICKDYITEKANMPLHYELIPIVMGGGDYKHKLPPDSYLDVKNFSSPAALAKYMHQLAGDETEYARYFQWKQRYKGVGNQDGSCVMCRAAHNASLHQPAYTDYYNWWHDACDNDLVNRMKRLGGW